MDGRKSITAFARTFLGSHYLWGSAGASPGLLNGSRYRPGSVYWNEASLQLPNLSVSAAKCDVAGHYVCAGRFEKCGGHIVGDDDPALTQLRSQYANGLLAQWDSRPRTLTPRVVRGKDVHGADKIVWGENCYVIRHFDCIGFINYVLGETTKIPDQKTGWSGSIDQWASNWTTDVPLGDPAVAGDILIRYDDDDKGVRHFHHIAFLDDNKFVIQAEMASAGVHADERYNPSSWQMRRRLEDRYIRPEASTHA
ncbi:MAG: hypothetical protein WA789_06120 [Candidatus Acidiferrum sp.]